MVEVVEMTEEVRPRRNRILVRVIIHPRKDRQRECFKYRINTFFWDNIIEYRKLKSAAILLKVSASMP